MIPHANRLAWLRDNFRGAKGEAYEQRDWVEEHLWTPLEGWRICAVKPTELCEGCRARVGVIVPWAWGLHDELRDHRSEGCAGLRLRPIILIALSLKRRSGKTFNTAAFLFSTAFGEGRRNMLFCASGGDQSAKIWRENFLAPIEQNAKIKKACRVVGNRIVVERTKSEIKYAETTSEKQIAGSSYTAMFFDECKTVPAEAFVAAAMSIQDSGGYRCARDALHFNRPGLRADGFEKLLCPRCGTLCEPWAPKIVCASTLGKEHEDAHKRWFNDLVRSLNESCPDNYHVFYSVEDINPAVYSETTNALMDGLGRVEGLRTFLEIEATNVPRRVGEDFLSTEDLRRVTDASLTSEASSPLACVGFLDTSLTTDKTTLWLMGWDPERAAEPWQILETLHFTIWNPREMRDASGAPGRMTLEPVWAHLEKTLPLFPRLELLIVDDRGNISWPKELIYRAQKERGRVWGSKVFAFQGRHAGERQILSVGLRGGGTLDRDLGWGLFESRVKQRTILLPALADIGRELLGVQRVQKPDGSFEIRDRNRKVRHVDLLEAIAGCCLAAFTRSLRPKSNAGEVKQMADSLATLKPIMSPGRGVNNF